MCFFYEVIEPFRTLEPPATSRQGMEWAMYEEMGLKQQAPSRAR